MHNSQSYFNNKVNITISGAKLNLWRNPWGRCSCCLDYNPSIRLYERVKHSVGILCVGEEKSQGLTLLRVRQHLE